MMPDQNSMVPPPAQPASMMQPPPDKKSGKVWIVISILLLLALVGLVVYGYLNMQSQNSKVSSLNSKITDLEGQKKALEDAAAKAAADAAKKGTSTTTDQDRILAAIRSQCAENYTTETAVGPDVQEYKIDTISGNYAKASYLCKGGNEGPSVILVKQNDNWNVVASGIGEIVQPAVRQLYSIPASFK